MVEVLLAALQELARQYWSVFKRPDGLEVIDIVPLALERFLRYVEKVDLTKNPFFSSTGEMIAVP